MVNEPMAVKICPKCHIANPVDAVVCVQCGNTDFEFVYPKEYRHHSEAKAEQVTPVQFTRMRDGVMVPCTAAELIEDSQRFLVYSDTKSWLIVHLGNALAQVLGTGPRTVDATGLQHAKALQRMLFQCLEGSEMDKELRENVAALRWALSLFSTTTPGEEWTTIREGIPKP